VRHLQRLRSQRRVHFDNLARLAVRRAAELHAARAKKTTHCPVLVLTAP